MPRRQHYIRAVGHGISELCSSSYALLAMVEKLMEQVLTVLPLSLDLVYLEVIPVP